MRSSAPLFLAAAIGCASSRPGSEQPLTPQTTRIVSSGGALAVITTPTSSAVTGELPFPVERVWAVLPSVYDSIGVPQPEVNAATRVVTSPNLRVRRRLAEVPLTRILDCGTTQGGPSAETYDVVMTIRTRVQPAGAGATTLTTEMEASAKPVSFSGDGVRCSTKGTLEQRIFDTVKRCLSG